MSIVLFSFAEQYFEILPFQQDSFEQEKTERTETHFISFITPLPPFPHVQKMCFEVLTGIRRHWPSLAFIAHAPLFIFFSKA
jgi:hypothetical protein